MALDLARWLPQFPVREHCLYLNHAAVAPLPRPVADAMRARLAELESSGARNWERWRETELAVRSLAGQLLACPGDDVSIVRSTSEGLSLVAQGLPWRRGDVVLVGDEEFAANVAPYLALAERGVVVRRFPTPGGRVSADAVEPLLSPPARLLALSWVAFHSGWVAPVAELASLARERGIVVVLDAIQGLGVLPAAFDELGVDAILAGWCNVERPGGDLFLRQLEFRHDGRKFEPGSLPTVLIAGLAAALELLVEVGASEIYERVTGLARTLTHHLLQEGWHVVSPGASHPIAGIVAAQHPFLPADEVAARLRQRQIEVAARQGFVRFSPHFYATAGELDALRAIVRKL
jgi:selenocysteine lyase/cysteine desulfurase